MDIDQPVLVEVDESQPAGNGHARLFSRFREALAASACARLEAEDENAVLRDALSDAHEQLVSLSKDRHDSAATLHRIAVLQSCSRRARRLLLHTFVAWSAESRATILLVNGFKQRRQSLVRSTAFRLWASFVQKELVVRAELESASNFVALRCVSELEESHDAALLLVTRRFGCRLLKNAFVSWHRLQVRRRCMALSLHRALSARGRRQLKAAFVAWKCSVSLSAAVTALAKRHQQTVILSCLRAWSSVVNEKRAESAVVFAAWFHVTRTADTQNRRLYAYISLKRRCRLLADVFNAWREMHQNHSSLHLVHRCAMQRATRCVSAVFRAWHFQVHFEGLANCARAIVDTIVDRREQALLRGVFHVWHAQARRSRCIRAVAGRRRRRTLRDAFREWIAVASTISSRRLVVAAFARAKASRVLRAWRLAAALAASRRIRFLAACFAGWRALVILSAVSGLRDVIHLDCAAGSASLTNATAEPGLAVDNDAIAAANTATIVVEASVVDAVLQSGDALHTAECMSTVVSAQAPSHADKAMAESSLSNLCGGLAYPQDGGVNATLNDDSGTTARSKENDLLCQGHNSFLLPDAILCAVPDAGIAVIAAPAVLEEAAQGFSLVVHDTFSLAAYNTFCAQRVSRVAKSAFHRWFIFSRAASKQRQLLAFASLRVRRRKLNLALRSWICNTLSSALSRGRKAGGSAVLGRWHHTAQIALQAWAAYTASQKEARRDKIREVGRLFIAWRYHQLFAGKPLAEAI